MGKNGMGRRSFQKTISVLLTGAIAPVAIGLPVLAETQAAPQLMAQEAAATSLCRAANRSTPVFESDSTVSSAVRLVAPNQQVTLRELPAAGSSFARITSPVAGFIQTAVLKSCGTNPPPPAGACRLLKVNYPVVVRREPKIQNSPSNAIGEIRPGERVTGVLTSSGSINSARADGYNWIEIDVTRAPLFLSSGTGWVHNSRVGVNESNFSYCP